MIVRAFDDDGYYYKITGYKGTNPDIVILPGTTYNITFINQGSESHDFRLTANELDSPTVSPGGTATFSITIPANGVGSYWDTEHQYQGMKGKVYSSQNELENAPGASLFLSIAGIFCLVFMIKSRRA